MFKFKALTIPVHRALRIFAILAGTLPIVLPTTAAANEPSLVKVIGRVTDHQTGALLPARIYVRSLDRPNSSQPTLPTTKTSPWHFVNSTAPEGTAVRYSVRNWIRADSEEHHTTISAHPFTIDLPPGTYEWTVERGKEYMPEFQQVAVGENDSEPIDLQFKLKRWIDMAAQGWYSGDTHVHRTLADLPNILLAEDLNVAFPLTQWVTQAFLPPSRGDKSTEASPPSSLIEIDPTHVIWPLNTEWEIFTINGRQHTLGAVFAIGHRSPFPMGAPPVRPIADLARSQGALLDMDKIDWPWGMTLPPLLGPSLFELANNHVWRTEFTFTQWNSPTPAWLRPQLAAQSGSERDWILYTLENYYVLLNCGFQVVPSAGTASGVHPVPLGFSRVYVHLPDGFTYESWKQGLAAGRSFVTTGPMLLATANGQPPGHHFTAETDVSSSASESSAQTLRITGEVLSEQPLSFIEVIQNGVATRTMMAANQRTENGSYRTPFDTTLEFTSSGWATVRCWEDRPDNRVRFAHTAAWHVHIKDRPHLPRREERDYAIARVQNEIERTSPFVPESVRHECASTLNHFNNLTVQPEPDTGQTRTPRDTDDLDRWLRIMRAHAFTFREMEQVTGHSQSTLETILTRLPPEPPRKTGQVTLFPYPGGRHPRIGFLDGAIAPQRDTKFSVIPPWSQGYGEYVVVDAPEAIWSNLGLTYLAHTHVPTIWSTASDAPRLPQLEWQENSDGSIEMERTLPNGIRFKTKATPEGDQVHMEMSLHNGTTERLTGLRIQNCVMLRAAPGFTAQTSSNKRLDHPFAMARSEDGSRWIVSAWERCHRAWANPPVPCLHSDPQFPDLEPGQTATIRGWLGFYEGADPEPLLVKIEEQFGWKRK